MNFGSHQSWESYLESLDKPLRFDENATKEEQDYAFSVLGESNRYFYPKHVASLPRTERKLIKRGLHPSQSHDRGEDARLVMERFKEYLRANCSLPITQEPEVGFYHGDQIIFSLCFDSDESWAVIDDVIPPFFEGFRILRFRQSEVDELNPK